MGLWGFLWMLFIAVRIPSDSVNLALWELGGNLLAWPSLEVL